MEEKKIKVVSSSGSRLYYPLEYKYSEEAKCFIPYYGKPIDRYEMIQASAPSCDINYIVKRALAGDYSSLNIRVPQYADISEVPNNLNDLNEFTQLSQRGFKNLDGEIKKLFDNDYQKFVDTVADGSFDNIMKDYFDSKNKVETVEKKESDK